MDSDSPLGDDVDAILKRREASGPESLPPVQPPSAGFIVQLFVVPALIVLAVVGVWALFGKLASSEQDWRSLVSEVQNTNPHRRWRGAHGLAQMLSLDQRRGDGGQRLAENPEIATELTRLLDAELARTSADEDDLKQRAFLVRTIGLLDSPDLTIPTLRKALDPAQDRDIRKDALAAVAMIAGRADERDTPLKHAELTTDVVAASSDADPLFRQLGAFTLGLMPSDASTERLKVLLSDSDLNARVNAAIGLARSKSTGGFAVFKEALAQGALPADAHASQSATPEERQHAEAAAQVEQYVVTKNVLKAVGELADKWSAEQRAELTSLSQKIADEAANAEIRIEAKQVAQRLEAVK